jgi:heme/copper-type cytochrome/quinol oxidase subunit 2
MIAWYKASIGFGIFPLIAGIGIYLIWLKTRANVLMTAGFLNILLGLISVLIAIVCLRVFLVKNRKENNKRPKIKLLIALFIIFSNFPAAFAIIEAVQYEKSVYNINIINNSKYSVEHFALVERNKEILVGDVNAKNILNKTIHFSHEGSVDYKFNLNGERYSGLLFGYVTSGLSFSADIIITEDKKVEIKDHDRIKN